MAPLRTLNSAATPCLESPEMDRDDMHWSPYGSVIADRGSNDLLIFGPFCLSIAERWLRKEGTQLNLSSRAFDILIALITRAGSIVSARELFEIVWPDVFVEASNLRVHIVALRKALGDGANGLRFVVNIPGRGYTFVAPIRRASATEDVSSVLQPRRRLPRIPEPLFGRDEVVEKLASTLLSRRFVSIVGPGGVGKTTVSIAIARMLRPTFGSDGVYFLDLAPMGDPTTGLAALLSIVPCQFDPISTQDAILTFLHNKRILLVLDNCEHVIDSIAPLAARIFNEAPFVHLLATSREALRVDGENVEFLKPLDHAPAGSQGHSPAVELFLERSAAGGGRSSVGDAEIATLLEICRRLDGLPLAIELVASRVGTHGLPGIAKLVTEDSLLALQGRRSALPRHQTLQALLDWSINLLSLDEQRLLMKLSTFEGAFTLEAVRGMSGSFDSEGTIANALAGLVDKSLIKVRCSDSAIEYKMPHITRAYCAQRLSRKPYGLPGVPHYPCDSESIRLTNPNTV